MPRQMTLAYASTAHTTDTPDASDVIFLINFMRRIILCNTESSVCNVCDVSAHLAPAEAGLPPPPPPWYGGPPLTH